MKRTLFILAAIAASTISAFAIDGQVLINQATVTARQTQENTIFNL
jgi:hypothetical protein